MKILCNGDLRDKCRSSSIVMKSITEFTIGWTCSTNEGDKECVQKSRRKHPQDRKRGNINIDLREVSCVEGTGLGSCPTAGFGVSSIKPSDCGSRILVS
jgi:hypothetical protein